MGVLADTNVLLRWAQPSHPFNAVATESVARLLAAGEDVCFTPQNVAEFWHVVTSPVANNGLGLDVAAARRAVERIERVLTPIPDTPAVNDEWKRLVVAHGVKAILTFNTDDFLRYTTDARHPI